MVGGVSGSSLWKMMGLENRHDHAHLPWWISPFGFPVRETQSWITWNEIGIDFMQGL
jgi:hypothetical protein